MKHKTTIFLGMFILAVVVLIVWVGFFPSAEETKMLKAREKIHFLDEAIRVEHLALLASDIGDEGDEEEIKKIIRDFSGYPDWVITDISEVIWTVRDREKILDDPAIIKLENGSIIKLQDDFRLREYSFGVGTAKWIPLKRAGFSILYWDWDFRFRGDYQCEYPGDCPEIWLRRYGATKEEGKELAEMASAIISGHKPTRVKK